MYELTSKLPKHMHMKNDKQGMYKLCFWFLQ